jgi:HSP20 family protein
VLFTSFDPFLQEFDRMTQRAFNWPAWSLLAPSGLASSGRAALPMDGTRHENEVVFRFDLPGIRLEDITVTVDQGTLTVTATRDEEKTGEGRPFARERVHGTLTRQIYLGEAYDADKVQADYHNGVLTVTVPVAAQAKARKVEISTGTEKAITA